MTRNNAVSYNNANAFSYVNGTSLSGTYGPLDAASPSTPGVYFPGYDPSVGGTGGSFSNGGVWTGTPAFNMAAYGLPSYGLPLYCLPGPNTPPESILVCGPSPNVFGTDPIILNLNGGAVDTVSVQESAALFDMQNNGQKVRTGWGTAGEGCLVYDPDDAGNATVVNRDSQLVAGFDALQALAQQVDGISNGSLTANDALWSSLKVWVDSTGTGQFQSGQLYSLDQLGISSLDLEGTQVNQDNNGNQILVDSTFTYANGSTGNIAGVNLMFNPSATQDAIAPTASLSDLQINNLIAGMASYGVQTAASSTLVAASLQPQQATLAANLH